MDFSKWGSGQVKLADLTSDMERMGTMSQEEYGSFVERLNYMTEEDKHKFMTMQDPLFFNRMKAKRWLKMRDLFGGSQQLSLEEEEMLENIRTDPKWSEYGSPLPPVPGFDKIDPELPTKSKPKSRDQGPSQEKSAGVRTAKGTTASGKSSGAKIEPHEYPSTFGGRSQQQTDSKKDDLDRLDEALCHRHAGDVCYLNGELADAVLAYSKGLDLLQKGPSQDSPPVMGLLYEEGRQQLLGSRVLVRCGIMDHLRKVENDNVWGADRDLPGTLRYMLGVQNYRDCASMMAADPACDLAYTVAAMEVVAFSKEAAVETLMVAVERCTKTGSFKESLKNLARQGVRIGDRAANKKELDAAHHRMMSVVVPSTEELCGTLKADHRSRSALARPLAGRARSGCMDWCMEKGNAILYQCPPYTQPLAQWDDEDLQSIDGDDVPSFKQACLATYPEGLYGELGLAKWLPDPVKQAASLKLAKRCNVIGNREARAGRLVEASLWYTRGLLVLFPEGRNHVDSMPVETQAVALALAFNRGLMYRAFYDHGRRAGGHLRVHTLGQLSIYDLVWCNYFGHGWVRALLAMCKHYESLLGRGETGQSLILVTAELKRMGAKTPTQLVEEAARLEKQKGFEYALCQTHSMEDFPAEMKRMLDEPLEWFKKTFPGEDVPTGHYRQEQALQLCVVPFNKLKQLLYTAKEHDRF